MTDTRDMGGTGRPSRGASSRASRSAAARCARRVRWWLLLAGAGLALPASAVEFTVPGSRTAPPRFEDATPPPEGARIGPAEVEQLRPFVPAPLWEHRRVFFADFEMHIGPPRRDYSPPPVFREATEANRGKASIGPDGSLQGYVAGFPFPMDEVDCQGDPEAGVKIIWNFVHRWQGFGAVADFRYSYFDRGELLPLHYQGRTSSWILKHRPEPQFAELGGDVFEDERRLAVVGFEVESPPQAAGTRTLTYRWAASYGPLDTAEPEETWLYSRQVRRVRKISETARSNAVAGTDFSFDDLFSFSGLPPQYRWRCLGGTPLLAPMNTRQLGFPYEGHEELDFGPAGLSYASDRWELRDAVVVEMVPREEDHPYSRKEIWLDRQTLQPLYSFAYDRTDALWKVIQHNHRWSEDDLGGEAARDWYPGWQNVPEPRDLRVVSDSIYNVQTGTGNRLDFWNVHGTAPDLRDLKRFVDVQRLRRGR